jgi:hypothetical protein
VILKVAVLLQVPMVAVKVMVALMAEEPEFLPVNAGITSVFPLDASPIAGLSLVQEKVAPEGTLVKFTGPMVSPLHTVMLDGTVISGVGLIVTGIEATVIPQLFVTDKVMVSLPGVLNKTFPGSAEADVAGVPPGNDHV